MPKRFLRSILVVSLTAAVVVRAQEPLAAPAPMGGSAGRPAPAGSAVARMESAQAAQDFGNPSSAALIYRELLDLPPGSGVDRSQVILLLSGALLDAGDIVSAERALQLEPPGATRRGPWHLRAGLVAAYQKNWGAAQTELNASEGDLPPEEPWWYYLQGMVYDAAGETKSAEEFYTRAEKSAVSDSARARFRLAGWDAALRRNAVTDEQLAATRTAAQVQPATSQSFDNLLRYAMMLAVRGQVAEAVQILQGQVRALSALPADRAQLDQAQVVLGLIGDKGTGANAVGRNVLYQVLARDAQPELQRVAVQILERASTGIEERADLRRQLDQLLGGLPRAPDSIRPDLLLLRAEMAANDHNLPQADADAKELLSKFPGSPLKANALGILVTTSWERGFFREAAASAADARAVLPPGSTRASLGLLMAEAYFRSGDFRPSADAYAAAWAERPPGVPPGDILFQRILAEIRAADLDGKTLQDVVVPLVDELAGNPDLDPSNRWQAEWNVARALLAADLPRVAYARITRLLDASGADRSKLDPQTVPRMRWLKMRLALDTDQPDVALQLADEIRASTGIDPEILSNTELLRGQAQLTLGREGEAVATFEKLRKDYPGSGAAASSYLAQATYLEGKEPPKIVEAEQLLNELAARFPKSEYAPIAIFRSAYLLEKRQKPREAYSRLEDLVTEYPSSDFVVEARLKQGDLMVDLDNLGPASLLYNEIIEKYPSHKELYFIARLRLANLHATGAANDPALRLQARGEYQALVEAAGAPVEVRIEAGYKLGNLLVRSGEATQAQKVWWEQVIQPYLAGNAGTIVEGGRHFLAQTLLDLGDLYRDQKNPVEARNMWTKLIQANLSDSASREAGMRLGLDRVDAAK